FPFHKTKVIRRRSMMRIQGCARSLLGLVIATALLFAGHSPGAAQNTGAVQGRVVEAGTQQPIAGAEITLVGTTRGLLTNAEGEFLLPGVPAGARQLRVDYIGYGAT